jgi:hypothetical protein
MKMVLSLAEYLGGISALMIMVKPSSGDRY